MTLCLNCDHDYECHEVEQSTICYRVVDVGKLCPCVRYRENKHSGGNGRMVISSPIFGGLQPLDQDTMNKAMMDLAKRLGSDRLTE